MEKRDLQINKEEMLRLGMASANLENALEKMRMMGAPGWSLEPKVPKCLDEPSGLDSVSTTHEAIFNHPCGRPHAEWVWIRKNSTVDSEGNLEFPASREDVRKFGVQARNVFLCKPSSMLHQSFTSVMRMNREEEQQPNPPKHPWKRRGVMREVTGRTKATEIGISGPRDNRPWLPTTQGVEDIRNGMITVVELAIRMDAKIGGQMVLPDRCKVQTAMVVAWISGVARRS
jgi:hypothetical protein